MRVTRQLSGTVDGIELGRFCVDAVYDVGTTIACYLLAMDAATPNGDDDAQPPLPNGNGTVETSHCSSSVPRAMAADRASLNALSRSGLGSLRPERGPRRRARRRAAS